MASHKACQAINRPDCQHTMAHDMFHHSGSSIDMGMMFAIWLLQESASCMV